jgi:hypothetical protein
MMHAGVDIVAVHLNHMRTCAASCHVPNACYITAVAACCAVHCTCCAVASSSCIDSTWREASPANSCIDAADIPAIAVGSLRGIWKAGAGDSCAQEEQRMNSHDSICQNTAAWCCCHAVYVYDSKGRVVFCLAVVEVHCCLVLGIFCAAT